MSPSRAPVSLLRASLVYTLAGGAASAAPLLLAPVLTRYLAPEAYGIVAMFGVLVNAYVVFMGLGVHGAVNRRYFDRERFHFPTYVASALVVVGVGAVVMAVLTLVAGGALARAVHYPEPWMYVVWLTALCLAVISIGQAVWQSAERLHRFAALQVGLALCFVVLAVLFVVEMRWDWQGRITAQLISVALFAPLCLILLYRGGDLFAHAKTEYVKDSLRYCLPLVPHMLGGLVIGLADRVMLARYAGLAETGIYASGAQLAAVLTILSSAVNNAWIPWFYRQVAQRDRACDIKVVKATYLIAGGYLLIAAFIALLTDLIVAWGLGPDYVASAHILPILGLALAVDGIYKLMAGYFFYYEKLNWLYRITLAATAVNVFSLYLGIAHWGAFGAGLAVLATNAFFAIATALVAWRIRPMPWTFWRARLC